MDFAVAIDGSAQQFRYGAPADGFRIVLAVLGDLDHFLCNERHEGIFAVCEQELLAGLLIGNGYGLNTIRRKRRFLKQPDD
ncbi:MAG: hypothetical protein ACRECC_10775 [Pseudolabrys sp.]